VLFAHCLCLLLYARRRCAWPCAPHAAQRACVGVLITLQMGWPYVLLSPEGICPRHPDRCPA